MNEKEFWNNKYRKGGISGKGSIGQYRNWKWTVIKDTIGKIEDKSFVDVGCGDMSFWTLPLFNKLRKCKDYFGIDISEEIINTNIIDYPDRNYLCCNAKDFVLIKGDIVLAMDLLFHIMENEDFETILLRLCEYSEDWIIIYNWINNPFAEDKKVTDGISQYYRNLVRYDDCFTVNDFEVKKIVPCPFDPYGALYFYRRFLY